MKRREEVVFTGRVEDGKFTAFSQAKKRLVLTF